MPAEAGAHCRENLFGEGVVFPRAEAREQGRGQDFRGYRLVDCGIDGPAAFTGILDKARIVVERVVFSESSCGEVEQPGRDDAAAPPDLGNVGDVEREAMFRRQRLDISVLENVETFGI